MSNENQNTEIAEQIDNDSKTLSHFMGLKMTYESGRKQWEQKWINALAAFNMDKDQLLNERYLTDSKFLSPKPLTKLRGIVSRKMKILFNMEPFGRIEDAKIRKAKPKSLINLWNRFMFYYQIPKIKFVSQYRILSFLQGIFGVAIAYLPHEYEEKILKFADDTEKEIVNKNDTYFRPIITGDFYTDPTKLDLRESEANILEETVEFEDLKALEKRTVKYTELIEYEDGTAIEVEREEEIGVYHNLDQIQAGHSLTEYQEEVLKRFYYSTGNLSSNFKTVKSYLKEAKKEAEKSMKTGRVKIYKCFGKWWFYENNEWIYDEAIVEIANGTTIIRQDRTPYQHINYTRPFLAVHENPMIGSFYCNSQIMLAMDTWMELNANRQMATDAKKRAIFHQTYIDTTSNIMWDGIWRKDGIIKGQGKNPIQPIINPNLQYVTNNDNVLFSQDIDSIFNLSTVQEGGTQKSNIPNTARGTAALIAQNDIPLNDKILAEVDEIIKPFLEILYERNLQFKTLEDLMIVWDESEIEQILIDLGVEITEGTDIDELINSVNLNEIYFEPSIRILGNMELSNEVAHQAGYTQFMQLAGSIPPIAKRVDFRELAEKFLRAYGIKDDAEALFINEESVRRIDEANRKTQQIQESKNEQMIQAQRQTNLQDFQIQENVKTDNNIREMQAEVILETATDRKIM